MRPIDADATMQRLEEWNTDDPTDKVLYNFAVNRMDNRKIIYLDDAIDALDCINGVEEVLRSLPSAQPEPQWIPCSERLPETDGEVLITVLDMEEDYVEVYKGFYQDQEWWTQWCHGCLKIKDEPCGENIVTAWMPLPEPYVERRQDG